jgi:two-component system nitrate/nitrite response regulator NarL
LTEEHDRPPDDATRVIIIDDSTAVRDGIRALIATDATLRTIGEASNATDGLQLARELRPDLVLLDNEMPGTLGIDLLPTLRSELPGTRVVMFSMSPSIAERARALGASAVVAKDGGDATLLEALRQVRRGDDATTVRLAAFAKLQAERPEVTGRQLGLVFAALAAYAIGYLISEPTLGAGAAIAGVAAVVVTGSLLGPLLGAVAAIVVIAITAGLWTITGHAVGDTSLRIGGIAIAAVALVGIGASLGALRRWWGRRGSDALLADAVRASANGADALVRRLPGALGCDAAILFGLSNAGRQLRVVSTTGVRGLEDERTYLGIPTLAESLREARIVVIDAGEDLITGTHAGAFAPVITAEGTAVGVLAVFYRSVVALSARDQQRLRDAAAAAEAVLATGGDGQGAEIS